MIPLLQWILVYLSFLFLLESTLVVHSFLESFPFHIHFVVASSWMHVLGLLFWVDIEVSHIQSQNLWLSNLTSWPQVYDLFFPLSRSEIFTSLLPLAAHYHFPLASLQLYGSCAQPWLQAVNLAGFLSNLGLLRSLLTCKL